MRLRPSPATLIALLALFVALGGPAEAQKRVSKLINGSQIKKNTIKSRQIANKSLTRRDLSAGTIRALRRTPFGSIGGDEIASRSITGSDIADSSIGSAAVADKTLTANDIAANSLTQGILAGDTVGNAELADNAVGKSNMRVGSVGKSEMAKESIGTEELIDGVARTTDVAAFSGGVSVDFPSIPAERCAAAPDLEVAPTKAATTVRAADDLTNTLVVAGRPATWSDDNVTLSARPVGPTTLRFVACNNSAAAVDLPPQPAFYMAFAF